MANELSTKVAPDVLKGIVTDDTSTYTLAHHIDAARGLDAEYKVLTGQYNLKDDYYEEEDLDTVFNDLRNIINLKIKASPEYTQKLKDAQIRARRMHYFEPTLVPDADFEIIREEN